MPSIKKLGAGLDFFFCYRVGLKSLIHQTVHHKYIQIKIPSCKTFAGGTEYTAGNPGMYVSSGNSVEIEFRSEYTERQGIILTYTLGKVPNPQSIQISITIFTHLHLLLFLVKDALNDMSMVCLFLNCGV